jgi:transcriptional regulator with XRE-family HTH domain
MNAPEKGQEDAGARVRLVRKLAAHSQQQMADALSCSWSTISKVETGVKPASEQLMKNIAHSYGVAADWLAAGTGPAPTRATIKTVYPTPETRAMVLREGRESKLPADWKDRLNGALDTKGSVFEAGVNEFGLPVKDAFRPVLSEFERRLKEK